MDIMDLFDWYTSLMFVIVLVLVFMLDSKRKLKLPPGPFNLPIVGYMPFLGQEPHEKLLELSKKYGKVFSLRLGMSNVVVLTDFELVKETFNKLVTSDRPSNLFHFMPDNVGIAGLNGTEWTEQRRYTTKVLKDLGLGKSKWETQVQAEVDDFVHFLEEKHGNPLDVKEHLMASISNNIFSLLFGYGLPLDHPKRIDINRGFDAFFKHFTQTGLICLFPGVVESLAKIGISLDGSIRKDLLAFNSYVRDEVNLRKANMNNGNEEAFVDRYLLEMKNEEKNEHSYFTETSLIGNVQAFLFGGIDTTTTTLLWLFLAMASYPDILKKIQKEVDSVLGQDGKPHWSKHSKLPYTHATILEVMRWRTLSPMNLQHCTREDMKIDGYDVPKGTIIIGLLYALHRDTRYWADPEEFRPERFLDEDGKIVARRESWAPFSMGKRNCPGETVAMIELFLYFTTLMHKFNVLNDDSEPLPDIKGQLGLVLQPKNYKIRFESRRGKTGQI